MAFHDNWRMIVLVARLSWRQLLAQKFFSIAMIINMALGLTGYLAVDGFNRSFLQELNSRTRQIASGDLVMSSRQSIDERQNQIIKSFLPARTWQSQEVSLASMVASGRSSRLVELRFVDDMFPLYKGVELAERGVLEEGAASTLGADGIWIYRELQGQLNVGVGGVLKVGEVSFTVKGIVTDDPSSGSGGFSFAPRAFLALSSLQKTRLLTMGSRVLYSSRYKIPAGGIDIDELAEKIKAAILAEFPHSDIRVQSHAKSSQEMAKAYSYLHDYLALISLVSLFLAALGAAYLINSHLEGSIGEIAIMSSLGAPTALGFAVFVLQSIILGLAAALVASMLAILCLPVLASVMQPFAGTISSLHVSAVSGLLGALICTMVGLLLCVPQLARLWSLNPSFLFLEAGQPSVPSRRLIWLGLLPALCILWVSAVAVSRSFATGGLFSLLLVSSAVLLALVSIPLGKLVLTTTRWHLMNWRLSLAVRQLTRSKVSSVSTFLALAIGATLINLIPQLRAVIAREVSRPDTSIPQLFLFDIQDEQVNAVKEYFLNQRANIRSFHPMVRARLESINDQSIETRKMKFEGEREQQQREALQSRTQNLSYRTELSSAETIVAGAFVSHHFDGQGLPALSLEEGFADRVGVRIGDRMKFDIMGVPLEGVVTGLRRVRWTTFDPNFMILVQPGVLDDAPKIWVGSVSSLPEGSVEKSIHDLVIAHSNISVVDIKSAVKRLLIFIDKTSSAVGVVAWLALLGGCGVLYAIAFARSAARVQSIGLLKVLGATPTDAQISVLFEYGLIAVAAIFLGMGLSLGVSYGITTFIFKAPWGWGDLTSVLNGFVVLPLSIFLAWLASRRSVRASILSLLK